MAAVHRDVRRLKLVISNVLNAREQAELAQLIGSYYSTRSVRDLATALLDLLDTPAKRQVIGRLRRVIPRSHRALYDQLTLGPHADAAPPWIVTPQETSSSRPVDKPPKARATNGHLDHDPPPVDPQPMPRRKRQTTNVSQSNSNPSVGTVLSSSASRHAQRLGVVRSQPISEVGDVRRVLIDQSMFGGARRLGLSIRGGAEHGLGVYVSNVDRGSVAEERGLVPGDLILAVNGVSFSRVTNNEAIRIIRSCSELDITVRHAGTIPGSYETNSRYLWMDSEGRQASPPPEVNLTGRYPSGGSGAGSRSALMLLKDVDERKVNLKMGGRRTLGIMVRGGNEVGLGVYVSGVDVGSAAHSAGLRVGDQILDVNGVSFLDVPHATAVQTLKSSKRLALTIKDVGKIPYAMSALMAPSASVSVPLSSSVSVPLSATASVSAPKRSTDRSKPSTRSSNSTWSSHGSSSSQHPGGRALAANATRDESFFTRGVGSQLMHSSLSSGQRVQLAILGELARRKLSKQELMMTNYFLSEYQHARMGVEELVQAFLELLDTDAKMSLMGQIRSLIAPRDLRQFDALLLRKDVEKFRATEEGEEELIPLHDTWAEHSLSSLTSSTNGYTTDSSLRTNEDEMDPVRRALEELYEDIGDHRSPSHKPTAHSSRAKTNSRPRSRVTSRNSSAHREDSDETLAKSYTPTRSVGTDAQNSMRGLPVGAASPYEPWSLADLALLPYRAEVHLRPYAVNEGTHSPFDAPSPRSAPHAAQIPDAHERWVVHGGRKVHHSSLNTVFEARNEEIGVDENFSLRRSDGFDDVIRSRDDVIQSRDDVMRSHSGHQSNRLPRRHADSDSEPVTSDQSSHRDYHRSSTSVDENPSRSRGEPGTRRGERSETSSRSLDRASRRKSLTELWPEISTASPLEDVGVRWRENWKAGRKSTGNRDRVNGVVENGGGSLKRDAKYRQMAKSMEALVVRDNPLFEDSSALSSAEENRKGRSQMKSMSRMSSSGHNGSHHDPLHAPSPSMTETRVTTQSASTAGSEQRLQLIRVHKTRSTLGIAIEGGANTRHAMPRVVKIQDSGSAYDSELREGHVIVEVNGHSLFGLEHTECAQLIAQEFKDGASQLELLILK